MRIREFYPESMEPKAVLVLPNHLGSSFESDFTDRAKQLSESLGMLVLAYERPGTSGFGVNLGLHTELQPSRYVQTAAQTGRELEAKLETLISGTGLRRILTGNSAAATDAVVVARSQTLQTDYLIAADPVGIQAMTKLGFRSQWLRHQRVENQVKSSKPIQNAAPVSDTESMVSRNAKLGGRFLRDVNLYGDIWRSSIALDALKDIAHDDDFSDLATNVAFVEHSFSGSSEYMLAVVNDLNSRQQTDRGAQFRATFMSGVYHSRFNDAGNYADFISTALAEIRPSPDIAA